LKTREEVPHLPFLWRQVVEALGLLELKFLRPVDGKPVKEGRVPPVASKLEEVPLETFVGCWKSVSRTLPTTPLKLNHNFWTRLFASKK